MEKLIIILIAAHVISEFFLNSNEVARSKYKLRFLFISAAVPALTSFLLLQAWFCWIVPLYVFVLHALIKFMKARFLENTPRMFIVIQTIYIAFLILLAWILVYFDFLTAFLGGGYEIIVYIGGFIAAVRGTGMLISKVMKRLNPNNELGLDGLKEGGRLIGELERTLIFIFLAIGQPMGIGFLLAGKSILRFHEATKQKLAEYVLIGTLLSFALAIGIAFLTMWAAAL